MEHSAFPTDETLAAFIDGRLDEETRKRVVAHVADCEDCYGTVMAGSAFRCEREIAQPQISSFVPRRNRFLIGLAAAAVIGVVVSHTLNVRYARHRDEAVLRDAAGEMPTRVTDERLSLDLAYKPLAPKYRAKESESNNVTLFAAASRVQEDARSDAAVRHVLGVALLLTGHREQAVETLEKVALNQTGASTPAEAVVRCNDVSLLNDLAAAHGAIADFSGNEAEKQTALEIALRAWQLDSRSPITAWNRAVATERVNPRGATAAWSDYLSIDSASSWQRAAKERIKKLETRD